MSASLIGWIVSLVFIVILASGFFIGLWRGLKRSTVSLVISIIGVIVAFFVTPLITNAILSIQVDMNGESVTLHSLILHYFTSMEEVGTLVEKNPNLETFFLNLPSALVNVVLFIFVTIAIECVLYIVYKILAATAFKIKPEEKKRRFSGGLVGIIKTFIVTVVAFMPMASLIGLANTCINSVDYGIKPSAQVMSIEEGDQTQTNDHDGMLASALPEIAINAIEGLENNFLTKMSSFLGLDDALFDYYGSFEIDGDKIVIRKEIVNIYNVIDLTNQLSKVDSSYTFKDFNYEKITTELNNLSSSPMFENILAETAGEIIINYKDYSFIRDSQFAQDNSEILDALSLGLKAYTEAGGKISDYFTDDISSLVNVATSFGESGIIDDIMALETLDVNKVIQALTSDDNYETFKSGLDTIFDMNLIRDGMEKIAKKLVDKLSTDVDPIGVSTENWTDEDWNLLSSSIASVAKRYGAVSGKIDVIDVIADATILLDETKDYDINGILNELGFLIDEVRAVNLLQTSENKPIIDKLLNKYKLQLPAEEVIANDGTKVTIDDYNELFNFISPSLTKMRDEGVYSTITAEGTTNDKIIGLAVIVSKNGNESLLSDIIMPLYQVEPTKSLIVDELTSNLNSELINMSTLTTYNDWKSDLNYISKMLKTLNSKKVGEQTFLSLVLNGNLDTIVDALSESDVDEIIKPVFYAKSTSAVKDDIISKIQSDMRTLADSATLTLDTTGVTFSEGNAEDQTQEFCDILKRLIPVTDSYSQQGDIKQIDKTILGEALETMKANAYRTQLSTKTEQGIFKNAFVELVNKFKSEYSTEVAILESNPQTLEEELGVTSLAEENYSKIDFTKLLSLLENATA